MNRQCGGTKASANIALFDLGRVVLDWEPKRLYAKIFSDPDACDRFLRDVCTMAWHTRHDAGASFADNAAPLIAQFPEFEAEIRAWGGRWMEMFDGYVDGVPALIEQLDARSVPLFALSNMPAETWPLMEAHFPLLDRFASVVVSGEIGLVKPDPDIFYYTLGLMGDVSPDEVLFIDDSPQNIAAADALGFQTHHFEGAAGLERTLKAHGLL